METGFAILVLLSVPLAFMATSYRDYGADFAGALGWSLSNTFAVGLLFSYIVLILVEGKQGVYAYAELSAENRKYFTLFILPSLGFGMAIFPGVAARFCENFTSLNRYGLTGLMAVPGWILILWLSLIILVS